MCIILTCEKNVRPDYDLIETCFWNNPDGAGIMWVEDGRVMTSKGFMDERELYRAIEAVPMDSRLVVHMRIATSGGINVGTCHPFPVCTDLDILHASDVEGDIAVAHNGVIRGVPTDNKKGISDTVWYVSHTVNDLYRQNGYHVTKSMLRHIKEQAPGNRFAVMTKDGAVYRVGVGWETVTKGIQASNSGWRWSMPTYNTKGWNLWSEDDDDWYGYGKNDRWPSSGSTYYYEGADFYGYGERGDEYHPEYQRIFDDYCDGCKNIGECMDFTPICQYVADKVDDWVAKVSTELAELDYVG
jgi:hypothetical protein